MAKSSRPGTAVGVERTAGRPRVLVRPVSVRVDIEHDTRNAALAKLSEMGHESLSEMMRAALTNYITSTCNK